MNNSRYTVGKDINTKDWWIYDDINDEYLMVLFDTEEAAVEYAIKLEKEGRQIYEEITKTLSNEEKQSFNPNYC